MAGSTSSIPRVIDALLAMMAGLPEFAGVQITDGNVGTVESFEIAIVGDATSNTATGAQTTNAIGRQRRHESYTVSCAISCARGGTDQRAVRNRAFELLGALESALAADPSLGGEVLTALVSTVELAQTDDQEASAGRTATVVFEVAVENDIYPLRG